MERKRRGIRKTDESERHPPFGSPEICDKKNFLDRYLLLSTKRLQLLERKNDSQISTAPERYTFFPDSVMG